jgi:hypothetical protein
LLRLAVVDVSLRISRYTVPLVGTWHIFLFAISLISDPKRLVWSFLKPSLRWLSAFGWKWRL